MAFTVPNYQDYYNKAYSDLAAYYERLLAEEGGDLERAKRRLSEDYARGSRIATEDYTRNTEFGREAYKASMSEEQAQSLQERKQTEGSLAARGVLSGGLAEKSFSDLKSKQNLRREAIDRALRKSEEDLKYTKERGLEEETIKQRRGSEDVASQWAKFQTEKGQERQEKALSLGEQAYNREFAKRSTEEGFRLQQESLNKMG